MPEGPEVRRAADRIERAIQGLPTTAVTFSFAELKPFESRLTGAAVERVRTRGKAFLIDFSAGLSVYVHLQLYGRWYIRKPPSFPATRRSLRFAIETDTANALLYSASEIRVVPSAETSLVPYLSGLGPGCLDPELRRGTLMRRLASRAFSGRMLAALYLDQGFLAGIGNYLRSEILFEARLSPRRKAGQLSTDERRRLSEASLTLSQRAYRTAGITCAPELVRELKAAGKTRRAYRHYVFARRHQPCRVCGTSIERVELAGRRLYLCPSCQRWEDD